jgi:hypothetical protein
MRHGTGCQGFIGPVPLPFLISDFLKNWRKGKGKTPNSSKKIRNKEKNGADSTLVIIFVHHFCRVVKIALMGINRKYNCSCC